MSNFNNKFNWRDYFDLPLELAVQTIVQEWIEVATEFNRPIPEPVYGRISTKGLLVEDADNSIKHSNNRQEKISIA
jgi:hypothetical protein